MFFFRLVVVGLPLVTDGVEVVLSLVKICKQKWRHVPEIDLKTLSLKKESYLH
jgi:hypothetical protein